MIHSTVTWSVGKNLAYMVRGLIFLKYLCKKQVRMEKRCKLICLNTPKSTLFLKKSMKHTLYWSAQGAMVPSCPNLRKPMTLEQIKRRINFEQKIGGKAKLFIVSFPILCFLSFDPLRPSSIRLKHLSPQVSIFIINLYPIFDHLVFPDLRCEQAPKFQGTLSHPVYTCVFRFEQHFESTYVCSHMLTETS